MRGPGTSPSSIACLSANEGPPRSRIVVKPRNSVSLVARQADAAVYCSCRCDGPDSNARYCKCPSGYACTHLVDELDIPGAKGQLAGSYCVRSGPDYDPKQLGSDCSPQGGVPDASGNVSGGTCNPADQG